MIDKLVIQIPFAAYAVNGVYSHDSDRYCQPWTRNGVFQVIPAYLPFKQGAKELYTDEKGRLCADYIYCPWEKLESSHGGLAVKAFHQGNGMLPWPYLEIKCSPAKLVQAHNVYGTDDPVPCVENMLAVLVNHYPDLMNGDVPFLNMADARVTEVDITYSVRVPGESYRNALIDVLRHTSKGQTRNRGDSFQTTCYFGSRNSRLKKIKVYLKGPEINNDIKERKKKKMVLPPSQVISDAQELVRFELTLKKDWLERRRLPTRLQDFQRLLSSDPAMLRTVYNEGMKDLFKSLSGEVMTVSDDKKVFAVLEKYHGDTRGRVARLMGFYQGLKSVGYDAMKASYPERTFYRYVKDLELAGFGRSHVCSLHVNKGNTVVAFPTVVRLDGLGEPCPDNYSYPRLAG
jgi:II/X family phage/plasmid replication protein